MLLIEREKVLALKLGDVIEAGRLFQGLEKDEPILWQLIGIQGKRYMFKLTYMGVSLGEKHFIDNGTNIVPTGKNGVKI